ncbi:prepilin-type N-terminal cleavage/methylation domain-containing protein [Lysobacter enzymogenes]|uniref:Type II secretion system protein H n=1 Tax=Lysobacter enzymogenes TaxID=69 RepID=A0A3N2RJQ5_LYSEN|nr:prepilin-type N-terminal cleavage/methylation domain-containing protein [Lysobacter enzymogenes]
MHGARHSPSARGGRRGPAAPAAGGAVGGLAPSPPDGRRGANPPRARQRGMSLLEMLLVIALIGAIGVLTVAALNGGVAGMQLRSASKQVAAQLRYTRSQAIASGRSQKFLIDPAAHTWSAPNGRSGEIPKGVGIVFTGARDVQPRRGEGAIVFFPDGASTGGRVKLHAKQAAWNVDVAWLTGEVKLKRGEAPR